MIYLPELIKYQEITNKNKNKTKALGFEPRLSP